MKRNFICLPIFLLIGYCSFAQKAFTTDYNLQFGTAIKALASSANNIDKIGIKMTRHFMTAFPQAENVQWYTIQSGTIALFTIDGKKVRSDYDKDGRWLFNLRHYDENSLPENVRRQIKMSYYDYKIISIDEIEADQQTVYLVNIEGMKSYKTIMVSGDEVELYNAFNKF